MSVIRDNIDDIENIPNKANSVDVYTKTEVNNLPTASFKNKLINGGFDVWQRGTSFSSSSYTADRWLFNAVNGLVGNFQKNTIASGIDSAITSGNKYRGNLNVTTPPTSATSILEQRIENVFWFSGRTVTISADVYCTSMVGNLKFNLWSPTITSGSNLVNVNMVTMSDSDFGASVVKITGTVTLPVFDGFTSDGTEYLALRLVADAGFTCDTFLITSVQLEEGSTATPFENRPIGVELALCQRYYQILSRIGLTSGASGANETFRSIAPLPVEMRATPTVVTTLIVLTNATTPSISVTTSGYYLQTTSAAAGNVVSAQYSCTLDAEL